MPIISSGQIGLVNDIDAEFSQGAADVSLIGAATLAGISTGDVSIFSFYGLSDVIAATITTNTVSSVGTGSFTGNANANDGGDSTATRGFYVGTSASYSSNAKYTASGTGGGSFSLSIGGFSQNTTYYVTAWISNSIGEVVGSTVSQLTGYAYTFKTNVVYTSTGNTSFNGMYYNNISGGWSGLSQGATTNSHKNVGHCTNRTNKASMNTSGTSYYFQQASHGTPCTVTYFTGGNITSQGNSASYRTIGFNSGDMTYNVS